MTEDYPIASKLEVRRIQERLRTIGINKSLIDRISQDNAIRLEETALEYLTQHHPRELRGAYIEAIKGVLL